MPRPAERFLESPAGQLAGDSALCGSALSSWASSEVYIFFLRSRASRLWMVRRKSRLLWPGLFGLQDHFRAELVARYLCPVTNHRLWFGVRLLWAQALLDTGNPVGCLKAAAVKSALPTGDPEYSQPLAIGGLYPCR